MKKSVKQNLIDIVGQANFTDQLIDMVSYSYDASDHHHRPDVVEVECGDVGSAADVDTRDDLEAIVVRGESGQTVF